MQVELDDDDFACLNNKDDDELSFSAQSFGSNSSHKRQHHQFVDFSSPSPYPNFSPKLSRNTGFAPTEPHMEPPQRQQQRQHDQEWNHDLELEQMHALEQLSLEHDFHEVEPLESTAFPSVHPPPPISSSPTFHRSSPSFQQLSTPLADLNKQPEVISSLKKQYEIDILHLKKQLLSEKQEHLEAYRKEMMAERQSLTLKLQDQIAIREKQWQMERATLTKELEDLRIQTALNGTLQPAPKPRCNDASAQTIFANLRNSEVQTTAHDSHASSASTSFAKEPEDDSSSRLRAQVTSLRKINDDLAEKETNNQLLIARQETEITSQHQELSSVKDQLQKALEKERKRARQQLPDPIQLGPDIDELEAQIEKKYSDAYKSAVEHLKTSYSNLTNSLRQKCNATTEKEVRDLKQKLSDSLDANSQMVSNFETQINILKENIQDLQARLESQRADADKNIKDMKDQYITTLRHMRDDVARSKARSIERIKEAWAKKKTELEIVWKARVDALKEELERSRNSKVFKPTMRMTSTLKR